VNVGSGDGYVLGSSSRELDRLDAQGLLYRDVTRRTLEEAGIGPGMQVLDLGSGSGDVAFLAGEMVGASGAVVGVERNPDTAEHARRRAAARGATNVSFRVAELGDRIEGGSFDAVVGRFILMHQKEPAFVLSETLRNARPGAAVAFVESCMASLLGSAHSFPPSPLYDSIVRWKCAVVGGAGADLSAGLRLRSTFLEAGLPAPVTRLDATVAGGPDSPLYAYMAESMRSMLPMARSLGVEGFDDHALDRLAGDLRGELASSGGVIVGWPVVSAWVPLRRS
jgi:SAM-dependent methyltransferase